MVSGETLALAAGGALAASEATGVTNVVPGLGPQTGGSGGRDGSPTSLPAELLSALQSTGSGLPSGILQAISQAGVGDDVLREVVEQAGSGVPADLAETIAANTGGYDTGTVQDLLSQQAEMFQNVAETTTEVPTADDVADEVTSQLTPEDFGLGDLPGTTTDTTGGGGGGGGGGGYDLAESGFTDPIRAFAETGKEAGEATSDAGGFLEQNPYVAAGTTIGAVSPDPITTALGFGVGSVTEVTADTLTGNTPLGVRSPIDVTDQNWWQGPAPLEGTSGVQDAQDAVQQFAGSMAVPTVAAASAASDAADTAGSVVGDLVPDGPLLGGGGGGGGGSPGPQTPGYGEPSEQDNAQIQQVLAEQNQQAEDTGGGGSGASSPTDGKDRQKDRDVSDTTTEVPTETDPTPGPGGYARVV